MNKATTKYNLIGLLIYLLYKGSYLVLTVEYVHLHTSQYL